MTSNLELTALMLVVYLCSYYKIIFYPKYRDNIFKDKLESELLSCFKKVCSNYGYELIEQEIMPDHAHLFISAPPTVAPVDIVRKLKGSFIP